MVKAISADTFLREVKRIDGLGFSDPDTIALELMDLGERVRAATGMIILSPNYSEAARIYLGLREEVVDHNPQVRDDIPNIY